MTRPELSGIMSDNDIDDIMDTSLFKLTEHRDISAHNFYFGLFERLICQIEAIPYPYYHF